MQQFGLIGYPLTHSFSAKFFNQKFEKLSIDAHYDLFPISDIDELTSLIYTRKNLVGLNVTIPYKKSVIPYLNFISPEAKKIGAVNTIKIVKGNIIGYNTDYIGFLKSLKPLIKKNISFAMVLGSGGSSNAVAYALETLNIKPVVVSRIKTNTQYNYQDLNRSLIEQHKLIINTTPLGMFPNIDTYPTIPYEYIGADHFLFDLVYNPEETVFLKKGLLQKAQIKNGLEMLHLQAEAAWAIWVNPTINFDNLIALK